MKVSLIIPVYNAELFLDECLLSIQNQTFEDWECLLINDGSKDSSLEICKKWAEKDSRFKVFDKENEGAAVTRAKGITLAQGEYLLYVDNDDYLLPHTLETLLKMIANNNADSAICSFLRLFEGKEPFPFDEVLPVGVWGKEDIYRKICLPLVSGMPKDKSFVATIWRMLFNRKIITDNNLTFTKGVVGFPDDLLFSFEYFLNSERTAVTDEPLYVYRRNTISSVSYKYTAERWDGILALYDALQKVCKDYGLDPNDYISRIGSQFLAAMSVMVKQEVQFIHQNGYGKALKKVKEIIYHPQVKKLFREPFVKEMAFQMKLFSIFTKLHMPRTLMLAVWCYLKLGMEK